MFVRHCTCAHLPTYDMAYSYTIYTTAILLNLLSHLNKIFFETFPSSIVGFETFPSYSINKYSKLFLQLGLFETFIRLLNFRDLFRLRFFETSNGSPYYCNYSVENVYVSQGFTIKCHCIW